MIGKTSTAVWTLVGNVFYPEMRVREILKSRRCIETLGTLNACQRQSTVKNIQVLSPSIASVTETYTTHKFTPDGQSHILIALNSINVDKILLLLDPEMQPHRRKLFQHILVRPALQTEPDMDFDLPTIVRKGGRNSWSRRISRRFKPV